MGNERSVLAGLEVEEDAIEVTEVWSMYPASFNSGNGSRLSVFISPMFPGISKTNTPSLIQAGKNLMLHRHPCILKYVSTWSHGGRFHLATEDVCPLSQVLEQQTALQVCLGLHSILKAVVFLHEKAKASHNNICRAAIYVSPDGTWKLGGFEFLCSFQDLSSTRLQQVRSHRYEKAVPPEEDGGMLAHPSSIDQYAFGVLVEEVLRKKFEGDELNSLVEFRDLARRQLQNSEPSLRPPLGPLLEHSFFDHQFLHIYSFLVELPLKSDVERQQFFRNLPENLSNFPEQVVATQLASLMLSRMVLLDSTAQEHLLPALLQPRIDGEEHTVGVFSINVFKQHVVPRLLQMLCVRDAQIRLLLLSHFHNFLPAFGADQLRSSVLPELLVGIKDTNDTLVSMTLKALAEMVLVLGSAVVIGGKRGKLFTDGRPKVHRSPIKDVRKQEKTIIPSVVNPEVSREANNIDLGEFGSDLPERPSPDGGEAEETTGSDKGEEEAWSDWDVSETVGPGGDTLVSTVSTEEGAIVTDHHSSAEVVPHNDSQPPGFGLPDIMALDIKNLASPAADEEYDFFQDMEPVISKPQVVQVEQLSHLGECSDVASKPSNGSLFDVTSSTAEGDAWGDDLGDWGLEENSELPSAKANS